MRILMIIHTPWSRDLGAPRVQLELAEELRALGHEVEKWSYEDAFPATAETTAPPTGGRLAHRLLPGRWLASRLRAYLASNRSFAARAVAHVRRHGHRFDVIEAHQTDLPVPKRQLGFSGLLVVRSVALIPTYHAFERAAAAHWPEPFSLRHVVRRLLTWPGRRRHLRDVGPSFAAADLINVSNSDDLATVAGAMGHGAKVVMFPFGLSAARRQSFLATRANLDDRLAAKTVAFIGTWNSRKGSHDWPRIVEAVLAREPAVRFRFLGTGFDRDHVERDFPPAVRQALEIVPSYRSEELPGLLATATVGAFPGYLEGFGFAVLELLAAGLPTVAYDAPGTRDMLRHLEHTTAIPPGDVEGFARRLVNLLALGAEPYSVLAADSTRAAGHFSWPEIARQTAAVYAAALERIRP